MTKPILYVLVDNHFDLTWRRCFRRRFTAANGDTYASYEELEACYIGENLALARRYRGYKFQVESPSVLRVYLERHPQRLAELRRLVQQRRFAVGGAGDNIVDANLILGESLVRNFVSGLMWSEQTLGQKTVLATRSDGFGNSAQLPQILRGCGLPWVRGCSYSVPQGNYWRGLDGSTVCVATAPAVGGAGTCAKYAPCPACRGRGCQRCQKTGMDLTQRAVLPKGLNTELIQTHGYGVVLATPEEQLPNPELVAWARRTSRHYDVRFALAEDIAPHLQRILARVDNPPPGEVHPGVELNPNNTGVFVTRIVGKQACRRQEYALLRAETLAALATLQGTAWPRAALEAVWQPLFFTMFHDAITGTHVDAAYAELQDVRREIDSRTAAVTASTLAGLITRKRQTLSVINALPEAQSAVAETELRGSFAGLDVRDAAGRAVPVLSCQPDGKRTRLSFVASNVPGLAAQAYTYRPAKPARVRTLRQPVIQNQRYRITADEHGLLSIFDRRLGREVTAAHGLRPNELIFEKDEGSPWATLSPHRDRTPLATRTRLVSAQTGPGFQRLTFELRSCGRSAFNGNACSGTLGVTLHEGFERVDFQARIRWQCHNARLRLAMPLPFRGRAIYGIPYGMLARENYEPTYDWTGANGDWPAVNWAGVENMDCSVALFNRGLPSYTVEADGSERQVMLLSLLRSPILPTYLHEPDYYSMTDYDGMRDEGWHTLEYALQAYDKPFADSTVVADAEAYNAGVLVVGGAVHLPAALRVTGENVRLAALKCAEDGNGLILRLVEFRGRGGNVTIQLPDGYRQAARTNLLEREAQPLAITNGAASCTLRPWEIATVRLVR